MNIEEFQKKVLEKAEKRAMDEIESGRVLREFDMRQILRQVIREEMNGGNKEKKSEEQAEKPEE